MLSPTTDRDFSFSSPILFPRCAALARLAGKRQIVPLGAPLLYRPRVGLSLEIRSLGELVRTRGLETEIPVEDVRPEQLAHDGAGGQKGGERNCPLASGCPLHDH